MSVYTLRKLEIMWTVTYKRLSGGEADAATVHARDDHRLTANAVGKRLGDLEGLGVGVKLWVGGGRHGEGCLGCESSFKGCK